MACVPSVMMGSTIRAGVIAPMLGNQRRFSVKTSIKISARKKDGVETASMDSTMMQLSQNLLWNTAARMPTRMPPMAATTIPPKARISVLG